MSSSQESSSIIAMDNNLPRVKPISEDVPKGLHSTKNGSVRLVGSDCNDSGNPQKKPSTGNLSTEVHGDATLGTSSVACQNPQSESSVSTEKSARPCRFYRRGNCRNGHLCRFLHADSNNGGGGDVTPAEGRVCTFYQQGRCRYGDSCRFRHVEPSHDDDDEEDEYEASGFMSAVPDAYYMSLLMRHLAHIEGLGEYEQEEMEQMFNNWGFTDDEVFELACQGVKPWDDDARLVLAALEADYDFYYEEDEDDDDGGDGSYYYNVDAANFALSFLDIGSSDDEFE